MAPPIGSLFTGPRDVLRLLFKPQVFKVHQRQGRGGGPQRIYQGLMGVCGRIGPGPRAEARDSSPAYAAFFAAPRRVYQAQLLSESSIQHPATNVSEQWRSVAGCLCRPGMRIGNREMLGCLGSKFLMRWTNMPPIPCFLMAFLGKWWNIPQVLANQHGLSRWWDSSAEHGELIPPGIRRTFPGPLGIHRREVHAVESHAVVEPKHRHPQFASAHQRSPQVRKSFIVGWSLRMDRLGNPSAGRRRNYRQDPAVADLLRRDELVWKSPRA